MPKLRVQSEEYDPFGEVVAVEEAVVETEESLGSGVSENGPEHYRSSKWFIAGKRAMLALIFLLPVFFLPGTMAPVEIAKTTLVFAAALFSLICFLAMAIQYRRFSYHRSFAALAVLSVVVASAVSLWFSIARNVGISGSFIESNSFLHTVAYALLFFFAAYFFSQEDLPKIGWAFFTGSSLAAVIGIFSAFGVHVIPFDFARRIGFTTVGSLYGWGIVMAMALAALTVLPLAGLSRRNRVLAVAAGVVMAIGLFALNYQTIWVGLAILMIMISSARFVAEERLGAPIVLAIAAVCFALLSTHLPRAGSLPGEAFPSFSASWSVAKHAAAGKRVIVGSGPSTFGLDYSLYRPVSINQTGFWGVRFEEGYNMFTTAFATQGMLGIFATLFLLWVFLRNMVSGLYDPSRASFTAAILMGFIGWFFHPAFLVSSAYLFIGLGIFVSLTAPRREVALRELRPAAAFVSFMALLFLAALSAASCYFLGQKYYAARAYAKGLDAFAQNRVAESVGYWKRAAQWDGSSDQYLRALSQGLIAEARTLIQAGAQGSVAGEIQQKLVGAVTAAQTAIAANPADALNYFNAGSVYESLVSVAGGAEQAAYAHYERAMALDPANPAGPLNAARARITAADQLRGLIDKSAWQARIDEAKTLLQKALDLKPDYAAAHFLLAQIYLREGDAARAVPRVEAIKAVSPFDAGIAFQLGILYYDSGQTDLAGKEFERALSLSADYANAMYFLGLVYDRQGKSGAALAQFRRIAELNPGNAEVERIIENLVAGRHALQDISPPGAPPEKRSNLPVSEERKR